MSGHGRFHFPHAPEQLPAAVLHLLRGPHRAQVQPLGHGSGGGAGFPLGALREDLIPLRGHHGDEGSREDSRVLLQLQGLAAAGAAPREEAEALHPRGPRDLRRALARVGA